MKKTLSFLLCAVMIFAVFAHTVMAEDAEERTVTVVFANLGYANSADITTIDAGSTVTLTFSQENGSTPPKYYTSGTAVRMYQNNNLTVSSTNSITSIVFEFVTGYSNLSTTTGTYSNDTWTGNSGSIVFANATKNQSRIVKMTITVVGEFEDEPEEPDPVYTTPEEILAAAYELADGQILAGGPYTLEGTITEINTPYNSTYQNISVIIEVDDVTAENNTILCFHMKNGADVDYVDQLKVNDHIKVTGNIKNYNGTIEFDANCTLDAYTVGTHTEVPVYETPEEILAAAYELGSGAYLSEGHVYTLEGTVTEINTAYSSEYKNITVTIKVDGVTAENNTIMCYRMVNGTGVAYIDQLKVGDHITVSGMIKKHNTTVEFDANCTLDAYKAAEAPTPEEIVNALYELDPGATLPGGPYTLSGVITDVTEKYNSQYEDITVVMVVGDMTDKPVTCYYLKNADGVDGVSIIGVGDTITVKGELTHYQNKSGVSTYEFAKNCELTEFTAYPKFASKQLSLAGDLGVHFYMDLRSLPEDALEDTYMEFTVSGKTVKVGFDPENMNAAGEYYGFTCRVNVLQMAENIHAVFHYGDSTVETDYSVEEYIGYIFEHADDYDEATVNLVSAICDYGYFSQQYLHECNGVKLGENGYAAQSPSPYGINPIEDYSILDAMEKSAELEGGAKFTYCLVLDSEITLELYVTVPDGEIFYDILVSFDDETYDNIEDLGGGRFRVTIPGISATQLETRIEVIYAGTTVRRLCPLSYAAAVKNAEISQNASNWADSLAWLYHSAAAYANNN